MGNKTYVDDRGYLRFKDTKKFVHRWKAEKKYGKLPKGMEVHHLDSDKMNNSFDNLLLLSKEDHYLLQEYYKKNIKHEGMIEMNSWARYLLLGIAILQIPLVWAAFVTQILTAIGLFIVYAGTSKH